jgi:hypothetical protein
VGEEVKRTAYGHAHRQEYRRKVQLCLDVFETMLAQSSFELDRPLTGMEIAGDLVDADYQPAMSNQHVLAGVQRRADARARARDDRCLPMKFIARPASSRGSRCRDTVACARRR